MQAPIRGYPQFDGFLSVVESYLLILENKLYCFKFNTLKHKQNKGM